MTDDEDSQRRDRRRQVIGILGEWAVANAAGVPYVYTNDSFKAPDIWVTGTDGMKWGLQVKASEIGKDFIIRPDAKDHEPYIYCLVKLPAWPLDPTDYEELLLDDVQVRVEIKGWMFPWEARLRAEANPRLVRDPGGRNAPAIFIPVPEIHPIQALWDKIGLKKLP